MTENIQKIDFQLSTLYREKWQIEQSSRPNNSEESFPYNLEVIKKISKIESQTNELNHQRKNQTADLNHALAGKRWSNIGPWERVQTANLFTKRRDKFTLENLEPYSLSRKQTSAFAIEQNFFSDYTVELLNYTTAPAGLEEGALLKAHLSCDNEITISTGPSFLSSKKKGRSIDFDWYNRNKNGQIVSLKFSKSVTRCDLHLRKPEDKNWGYVIHFQSLETLAPQIAKLNQSVEICASPIGFAKKDPVSFFWQQNFDQVSCPQQLENFVKLADPIQAIQTKMQSLTGSEIKPQALERKNPFDALDFKNSPYFDFIYVSSLNFGADFYGTIMAKVLQHHADQGTQIRILVSDATLYSKDKNLLSELMNGRPNVKIQYYKFKSKYGVVGDLIDRLHRINHVKLLVGLSFQKPSDSFMITGGRNILDPYLFKEKPDHSQFSSLIDYANDERPFTYYDDFEVKLTGNDLIQSSLSQVLSFWNRDEDNYSKKSVTINLEKNVSTNEIDSFYSIEKPVIRSILSAPYSDNRVLEKFYVEMIESAEKEILVTTPYFRPTAAISKAFGQAAKRGVKVTVITRLELDGDDTPSLTEKINKEGANKHRKIIDIYESKEANAIVHAKFLVIDNKLSFISSVNLNHRSFIHDIESGFLILHGPTAQKIQDVISGYLKESRKVSEKKRIKWLDRQLVDIFSDYF